MRKLSPLKRKILKKIRYVLLKYKVENPKITQYEIAKQIGISSSYLSHILNPHIEKKLGRNPPLISYDVLYEIMKLTKVDANYIFFCEEQLDFISKKTNHDCHQCQSNRTKDGRRHSDNAPSSILE